MPTHLCSCGAQYRFAEASRGKRGRCSKCGAIFVLEGIDAEGPIPLAGEHESSFGESIAADSGTESISPRPVDPVFDPLRQSKNAQVAQDDYSADRTYVGDLAKSYVFFTDIGDLLSFVGVLVALGIGAFGARILGCAGTVISLLVISWYSAYRFEIIVEAASGSMRLPEISASYDWRSEFIGPWIKWISSWLLALSPALVYAGIQIWTGNLPGSFFFICVTGQLHGMLKLAMAEKDLILFALILCGAFAWPLVVLCTALGGLGSALDVSLFMRTMLQTLPPYALTVALAFLPDVFSSYWTGAIWVAVPVRAYLEIASLKAVGLYYHHFKRDFGYDWG